MASSLSAYSTRDSPFLDLASPFTAWYARARWRRSRRSTGGENSNKQTLSLAPLSHHRSQLFSFDLDLINREFLKLLLLSPLIIPRCLGALAACTLLACMSALAAWDWPESQPLSKPRRALTVAASKLAGVVLWSLGFSVRVHGREHLKEALRAQRDRPILIFNHVSKEKKKKKKRRREGVGFFSLSFFFDLGLDEKTHVSSLSNLFLSLIIISGLVG